jgi:hypothetical protein
MTQPRYCSNCKRILNGRGRPNISGLCSSCNIYSQNKKRREKLHDIKLLGKKNQ